ncbi:MAG: C40 family peptidase [Firmicutes bacterium]|jgi:hypothetical protein|nr:C40 family peptidase [Bacillota bacterium]
MQSCGFSQTRGEKRLFLPTRLKQKHKREAVLKTLKPVLKLILVFYLFIALLPGCSLRKNNKIYTAVLSDEAAERALEYALDKVDRPYVLGGQGPEGFDCSGLVIWAYMEAYPGLKLLNSIPRSSL